MTITLIQTCLTPNSEKCLSCWPNHGFLVIDKDSEPNEGRYRKGFDCFVTKIALQLHPKHQSSTCSEVRTTNRTVVIPTERTNIAIGKSGHNTNLNANLCGTLLTILAVGSSYKYQGAILFDISLTLEDEASTH